ERERISLGIKQLDGDPFRDYMADKDKGSVVVGEVVAVDAKNVEVKLADEVFATLRANDISSTRVDDASSVYKMGSEVQAMIINFDRKSRFIQISVKAMNDAQQKIALEQSRKESNESGAGTTNLGDILRVKLHRD
ncbi:MAG: S1 RNA-binding domain-containing protein, partial [Gammaproteobacteria bacterium]|nr:S1 RNA-binding domain-containing protein [Gammaproteobacteria bacterium]